MIERPAGSEPVKSPFSKYQKLNKTMVHIRLPLKLGFDAGDRVDDQLGKSVASLKLRIGGAPSVNLFVW